MRRFCLAFSAAIAALAFLGFAENGGPYKVLKTARVGGAGGFDYVNADEGGRKLYVARSGQGARITVFDLDTLEPAGEIPNVGAHGAVVSSKTNHGFASSKPVVMFDSKTLAPIKTIEVEGNPDGMLYDSFNDRVYVLSARPAHIVRVVPVDLPRPRVPEHLALPRAVELEQELVTLLMKEQYL